MFKLVYIQLTLICLLNKINSNISLNLNIIRTFKCLIMFAIPKLINLCKAIISGLYNHKYILFILIYKLKWLFCLRGFTLELSKSHIEKLLNYLKICLLYKQLMSSKKDKSI